MRVFSPGSRVGYREEGAYLTDVEIIAPHIMVDGTFMYQVKFCPMHPEQSPVKKWVSPNALEPLGDEAEWGYAWWDPESQEFVEGEG
jgi:hypothetical protein